MYLKVSQHAVSQYRIKRLNKEKSPLTEEFHCCPSAVLVWEDRLPRLGAAGEAWLSLPFQDPGYTLA